MTLREQIQRNKEILIKNTLEQGILQGITQGREETSLYFLKSVIRNANWAPEYAMDMCGIAEDQRDFYRRQLKAEGIAF